MALDPPASIGDLNTRSVRWQATYVHSRPHRTTGGALRARLEAETPLLGPGRVARFDTARACRRYLEVRMPADAGILEIRHHGTLVVTNHLDERRSGPIWDPAGPPTQARRRDGGGTG